MVQDIQLNHLSDRPTHTRSALDSIVSSLEAGRREKEVTLLK
ncbi:hypothetical protein cce_4501 [Crocosphaera subtropica ATCC 51142]|uniref:Uncharacterized protein n=1 Tax=Crocosphaera subtropica (strain ATCC 51142 / BH68) TaxID=43989 RepID=B1WUJ5_CROS5|nr:hypothetical protein [Crocosphaera subtropica]ACB53849.1 hypothetical protein cce_4501 [Crocosphaera subtropica ATCC 51142]